MAVLNWTGRNTVFGPQGFCQHRALEFTGQALRFGGAKVALFLRTAWLESIDRHARLWANRPPSQVLIFSERVPIVKGRCDPKASSATSYSWFVWTPDQDPHTPPAIHWIPPGTRARLERPGDYDTDETAEAEADKIERAGE